MDILRFITAGNIDDGKSTLIGRLLLDTDSIKDDILHSVSANDEQGSGVNLAFITDGLRAERQAGITIDVAYKYFTTAHRKFIITDAPGHFQYTKNLVTGASGVDVMIILIDARNGISAQTRRHSLVASFLGIKQIVVAVNKMDVMGYDEKIYSDIKDSYAALALKLNLGGLTFIPISALNGDNVTARSGKMPWYSGSTLLEYLERAQPGKKLSSNVFRCPVQYVDHGLIFGSVTSGTVAVGDTIINNSNGKSGTVQRIIADYKVVREASEGADICLELDGAMECSRGDIFSHVTGRPCITDEFEAEVCWLDDSNELIQGKDYLVRINTASFLCRAALINSKTDNDTFEKQSEAKSVTVNEFASVTFKSASAIVFDHFDELPATGRGIIIDPQTNNTSGAIIIRQNKIN